MSSHLNWIDQQLSKAGVLISSYIIEHGVSHDDIQQMITNGDIERIAIGLYAKKQGPVFWADMLNALQNQMHLDLRLSGLTSLVLQGAINLPEIANQKVQLASNQFIRLPKWAHGQEWSFVHKVSRLFKQNKKDDLLILEINGHKLKASTIELALLELMEPISEENRFAVTLGVMKSMDKIDGERMQSLLERSESAKANRLFLHFANKCKHAWLEDINEQTIDLGEGEIHVIKDGILDDQYNITIPAFYPA